MTKTAASSLLILTIALIPFLVVLRATPAFALNGPWEMLSNPKQEARAEAIGRQLRCLVCQNESIEASDAALAAQLREIIRQKVAAGQSNKQIIAFMVRRYGDFILLRPPFDALTALLWATPILALATGFGIVLVFSRNRRVPPPPLSEAEKAKLRKVLRS